MPLRKWADRAAPQTGAPRLQSLSLSRDEWLSFARDAAAGGSRLLTLWGSGDQESPVIRAVFLADRGGYVVTLRLNAPGVRYPGLEDLFPAAARMQRAIADLSDLHSTAEDARPWLRHTSWPREYHPLIDPPLQSPARSEVIDSYEFVRVEGDGVHEIPVGPVHAGIIEPGHFRFSVVGEKVLRLEERLGYVHKGIEQRFSQLSIHDAHRLAARISGDSAVAFSWAYCQALEGSTATEIPARAAWLRALYLELERIANHLGDLGALGNDAGFAFGLAQFSRLKELILRMNEEVFGERYLMEAVVPGGTRRDLARAVIPRIRGFLREIIHEVLGLRAIYEEHEGVRDRFNGAGAVAPELAARLGLIGLAGRASGQAFDLRVDLPCEPYSGLATVKMGNTTGDVAARVTIRFNETLESCRLVQDILGTLPEGPHRISVPAPADGTLGIGLIEGWRGPVCVALEAGPDGAIRRCHPHDPSWQNWPALEHAIIGNIVPDFPLINKSFNLSYSGHDS